VAERLCILKWLLPVYMYRSHGIFRLTTPGGMSVIRQCQQRGFHPHNQPPDGGPIYDTCTDVYMNPDLKFDVIDLRWQVVCFSLWVNYNGHLIVHITITSQDKNTIIMHSCLHVPVKRLELFTNGFLHAHYFVIYCI